MGRKSYVEPKKCPKCKREFTTPQGFDSHKVNRVCERTQECIYECPEPTCGHKTPTTEALRKHMTRKHDALKDELASKARIARKRKNEEKLISKRKKKQLLKQKQKEMDHKAAI